MTPIFFVLGALERPDWFIGAARQAAALIEGIGILIVVAGGILALGRYALAAARGDRERSYRTLRRGLGRSILLGLEFLVAADIIGTVLVSPTLSNAASLGLIVLIRTFLSWSLELEIEGRWPWQKRTADEGSNARAAIPPAPPTVTDADSN